VAHRPERGDFDLPAWRFYADVTARLLRGCINKRELVTVLIDIMSTPRDVAFEDVVRGTVNNQLGNTAVARLPVWLRMRATASRWRIWWQGPSRSNAAYSRARADLPIRECVR
jgi:hypothetical protein